MKQSKLPTDWPTLAEAIASHVAATLEFTGGNRSQAARLLDCSLRTVQRYLRPRKRSLSVVSVGYIDTPTHGLATRSAGGSDVDR